MEISDQSPYFTFVAISPQQYKWSFIVDIVDLHLKCLTRVSRFFLLMSTTACFKTSLRKSSKVRSSLVRAGYPGLTPRPPSPDIWTYISSGRLSFTPFSTLMYISAWAFSLLLMLCLAAHRLHPDLILTASLQSPKPYCPFCLAIKLAFCTLNQSARHRAKRPAWAVFNFVKPIISTAGALLVMAVI